MPEDPRTTVKFPKVVPVEARPRPTDDGAGSPGRSSSQPSAAPEWYDDPPTLRANQVAITVLEATGSPDRTLLTVIVGMNAGQVFTLDRDESVIGRAREAHVHLDEVGVSRKHARILRTADGRHILEDLGSSNGTFVAARRVERVDLANGDRVQIGPAVVLRFGLIAADEEALARQLYEGSTRDALTQIYNRKYVTERLAAEVAYAHRHRTRLSVILFDVDHFKRVNDSFGHAAGDSGAPRPRGADPEDDPPRTARPVTVDKGHLGPYLGDM